VVPTHIPPSSYHAALAYAEHGWYVLPISNGKHAGSYLGKGWPNKSTRDPDQIKTWYHNQPNLGVALHAGKSGTVIFDVDDPRHLPVDLVDAIADLRPPFQSTRSDDILRGHYVFRLAPGTMFGNGVGSLRTDPPWGEVRGRNGIIVAAPTRRTPPKRYRWIHTGQPPELPKTLGRALLPPPRKPPPEPVQKAPRLYLHKRIRGLITTITEAKEGTRNEKLFWAACRFGEMAAEGLIGEDVAHNLLIDTGVAIGLPEREATHSTISGLRTGSWVAS
jgi:hypothetical protein